MNFDCWLKLNCTIFGSWLYFNACLICYRWVHLLFIATHDLIWYMYVKLLYINEYNSYAWWNHCQKEEKQCDFFLLRRACFWFNWEFLFFSKVREIFFWIFEHNVYICTKCAFYDFCFYFQTPKHFFWWVCQCVHQGGDCKIKGVFYYYSVTNNWHRRLLVLIFEIYSRSGFVDDWISQVNLQDTVVISCDRSDRRYARSQTGQPTVRPTNSVPVSVSGWLFGYPWLFHDYGFQMDTIRM